MGNKSKVLLEKATPFEKLIYGIGDIGANFCWMFMSMFITMYYTDSIGITAAFAGTMMFIVRIFDGVSDVLFASLIEKASFKWGKIRPWFVIAAPLMGIGLYLCFNVPIGLSESAKQIYVFATYFFVAVIAYTIYNIAYSGFLPLMSLDSNDRNIISALGRILSMAGILVMNIITPILLGLWGGERAPAAWSRISMIYAIFCAVLVALMGIFIKEKKVEEQDENDATKQEQISLKELLMTVLKVKQFWLLLILFMVFFVSSGVAGVSTYFYRDVLGNMSLLGAMSLLGVVPTLICMPFVPMLFKKFGKTYIVMVCLVFVVLSDVAALIWTTNIPIFCVTRVINSVGKIPYSAAIFTFVADLVDYVWEEKKVRTEGLMAMSSSVGTKIGTGLGTALVGWGLTLFGYNALSDVQSSTTVLGIKLIFLGVPVICSLVTLIIVRGWNIGGGKE